MYENNVHSEKFYMDFNSTDGTVVCETSLSLSEKIKYVKE
jgi:hypothetical protein